MTLTQVEFKSLLQDVDRGDVEMFPLQLGFDYNAAYTFAQYLKSDFGVNQPHYASEAYDALLTRRGRGRSVKRRALLEEAERTMLADHPLLPIYLRQQAPGEAAGAG